MRVLKTQRLIDQMFPWYEVAAVDVGVDAGTVPSFYPSSLRGIPFRVSFPGIFRVWYYRS